MGLDSLFVSILQVLNLTELGVGSVMVYSMYKPIAEDDSTKVCALMKPYRTYYRVIGAVIAITGLAITPFIPKLIKSDLPADVNAYVLSLMNLALTVLSYWLFAYKNSLFQAHQRTDVPSVGVRGCGGMWRHGAVGGFIRIKGILHTLCLLKGFQLFDDAVGIFGIIFRNPCLHAEGIKEQHRCFL